jgi:hypothetical protein
MAPLDDANGLQVRFQKFMNTNAGRIWRAVQNMKQEVRSRRAPHQDRHNLATEVTLSQSEESAPQTVTADDDLPQSQCDGWSSQIRRESRSLILSKSDSGTASTEFGRPGGIFTTESGKARIYFTNQSRLAQEVQEDNDTAAVADPTILNISIREDCERNNKELREVITTTSSLSIHTSFQAPDNDISDPTQHASNIEDLSHRGSSGRTLRKTAKRMELDRVVMEKQARKRKRRIGTNASESCVQPTTKIKS